MELRRAPGQDGDLNSMEEAFAEADAPAERRAPTREPAPERGFCEVELGGLEPPTSWVRSRRSPN